MRSLEKKLQEDLAQRKVAGLLRELPHNKELIDFCSNDYLGWAGDEDLKKSILHSFQNKKFQVGSSGSRLISGNSLFAEELERKIAAYHHAEAALIFNSGYDANVGFFSAVPKRGDTVLYDELIHASIRDGIRLGLAKSFSFKHNDVADLKNKISKADGNVFVAVESIYSMDGDAAPLIELSKIDGVYLVVDEAHSAGVCGVNGEGKVFELGIEVFARLVTYGKAFGAHGAAILGSNILKEYLINYSRSFIYTTFCSDFNLVAIDAVYDRKTEIAARIKKVQEIKKYFLQQIKFKKIHSDFIPSDSLIHGFLVRNNSQCKHLEQLLKSKGFAVKAILSPTVPEDSERLRISLHYHNTPEQVDELCEILVGFLNN
ncbi:MAG: aminotransferase class I/II-fold pyridoxal phosphate-dependent enzyme [Bacteroidetes bacterium]|nr:aminotransferase class I/II-fold pyridoxal phosphate-dependent enzyme [Bacteroidota bacterium]